MMNNTLFNKPQPKQTISLGQSLLILIDFLQQNKTSNLYKQLAEIFAIKDNANLNMLVLDAVKQFYLMGIRNKEHVSKLCAIKNLSLFANYEISTDDQVVNEDASRRYFESQLAIATLKQHLAKMNLETLIKQSNAVFSLLPKDIDLKKQIALFYQTGILEENEIEEYGYEIQQLRTVKPIPPFSLFTAEEKNKLLELVMINYLALICLKYDDDDELPLNIYHQGFFQSSNRGRLVKLTNEKVGSNHFGIMKNYMPLAKNDNIYSEQTIPYTRPVDLYSYNIQASWPMKNFSTGVQPFISSISGTLLCLLRVFADLSLKEKFYFHDRHDFNNFIKCYTSMMLLMGGGHSYSEFLNVLFLDEVKLAFFISIYGIKNLNEAAFIYDDNQPAFDDAINKAIEYNRQLIKIAAMRSELLGKEIEKKEIILQLIELKKATIILTNSVNGIKEFAEGVDAILADARKAIRLDMAKIKNKLIPLFNELEKKLTSDPFLKLFLYQARDSFELQKEKALEDKQENSRDKKVNI